MVHNAYATAASSGNFRGCDMIPDWRDLIERPDIDAVVISTPDHWHAIPSIRAAKKGKDVFCEKPLSLTVHEGRVIADTMERYNRIFQVGTPNRSRRPFHQACEIVRNGLIGKLHTIRLQICRGYTESEMIYNPNETIQPVPPEFNYDMWLGQAPEVPYTKDRCHFFFRYNYDYSAGNLTDFGAHVFDVAQWGNNTEHTGPVSVDGRGIFTVNKLYNVATDFDITYQYANGVTMYCKSGGFYIRFEGTDGWVQADNANMSVSSPELLRPLPPEAIHLRTCPEGEQRDFLNCVKTRMQPYAPAEIEHRSITLVHIGTLSMRLGRKLAWNPEQEYFDNDPEANRMLKRAMRSPWRLE